MNKMETNDEMSFTELLTRLQGFAALVWRSKWKLSRVVAVFAVCGFAIAFGSAEEYTAKMRILPYGGAKSSGLSGLAGLAGVRLPGGSEERAITTDLYPELLRSIDFQIALAEAPLAFTFTKQKLSSIEYFSTIHRPTLLSRIARFTFGLPSLLKTRFTRVTKPKAKVFRVEGTDLRVLDPDYVALVQGIGERVAIDIDRRTSVMLISARMPDAFAAADIVRVTADNLMEKIISFESRKAAEHFKFIQQKYFEAEKRYNTAQRELALYADRNRVIATAVGEINLQRLKRDHDITFELFQQLGRELEQARLKIDQDSPVFAVFEGVTVPTSRTSPRRTRIVLSSVLVGFCVGIAGLGLFTLIKPTV